MVTVALPNRTGHQQSARPDGINLSGREWALPDGGRLGLPADGHVLVLRDHLRRRNG